MSVVDYPLRRVWKVASRWSEDGHADSSVLDVFREHKVVFVGRVPERFSKVEPGDLIVVSNGTVVVAMGAVVSEPTPITSLRIPFSPSELARFAHEDWVLGCRIDWVDLQEENFVSYRIGAFHEVRENAEHYRELYGRYLTDSRDRGGFAIHARSCSLGGSAGEMGDPLWRDSTRYVVPVFQRPYSWGETEVTALATDLIDAFTGRNGGPGCEPMFIGTMQIGSRLSCEEDGFCWEHHVIDGQQRLSTLLLLLRVLEESVGGLASDLPADYRQRLITKIGKGVQQRNLDEALAGRTNNPNADPELNVYLTNLRLLREIIEAVPELDQPKEQVAFIRYLVSMVYFVVIETRAGLSKTLEIFKAINTTGLDLDGGDVFKIRFYEYRRLMGDGDEVLDTISNLYDQIDGRNEQAGRQIARMSDILSIARHCVATEAGLPHTARLSAGPTFFEHFFDVAVNRQRQNGFAREKCEKYVLDAMLFEELIEARFRWELEIYPSLSAEAQSMVNFIWWGRYASYFEVLYLFCHRFDPTIPQVEGFAVALSKLLSLHSLLYERINDGRKRFMHELLERFAAERPEETVDSIVGYIEGMCSGRRGELAGILESHSFAWLSTKNLACRLLGMLAELRADSSIAPVELHRLLFEREIDIEHIEPCNHENEGKRAKICETWREELHRLGNLIVLERNKNRGKEVSNKDYTATKRKAYQTSEFAVVQEFAANHENWNLESAIERKGQLVSELADYLCGKVESK